MQTAAIAAIVLAIAGCGMGLMPTPNIYVDGAYGLYDDLDPALRSSTIDLLYATDRAPIVDDGALRYGYQRSRSVAFAHMLNAG